MWQFTFIVDEDGIENLVVIIAFEAVQA